MRTPLVTPLLARLSVPIVSLAPDCRHFCGQRTPSLYGMTQQCQGSTDLQAATDEYIEQNDNRFGEVAALLLKGRADLAAERIDSPAALSLGEQGRQCIMAWHAMELADVYACQDPSPLLVTGMC